jgi:hypothetical protein
MLPSLNSASALGRHRFRCFRPRWAVLKHKTHFGADGVESSSSRVHERMDLER